ncbi:enkurin [Lampris incognitus]|uniref:enkurin n=1 Tax=Lampris incognitus TaxID=2546036 RepID=UPI0024B5240C|nr:enkurin [Lampris incognitus]
MSTAMYPQENIHNFIPKQELKVDKPPRYISKFRSTVVQEKKLNKDARKTMGPVKVEEPSPKKYLRKHSREPTLCSKVSGNTCTLKKPEVPKRMDNPRMGIHPKKDFVKTNAMENIMAVPRKPQPIYADTKRGHKQPLENSGLVPKYIKKKDYGETPEYLLQRKEEVRKAQEANDNYDKERMKQEILKQLSEEERQTTLESLKKNWGDLHHQYQGLSVVTDTTPKKHHKERLELAMKQLEDDIGLIGRCKTIYIADN